MKILLYLSIILLYSCIEEQPQEEYTTIVDRAKMDENSATIDFNGKIPSSNKVIALSNSETTTWRDFDGFYKKDLAAFEGEHYYRNLQWILLANIIKNDSFLNEADSSLKLYYLNEILSRDYINQPEVAVILLNDLRQILPMTQIAADARLIYNKNQKYLTKENFSNHQKTHSKGYIEINQLGWSRWGEPK